MWLSGHIAKGLTQDSLFSPKWHPVLACGVGRPSGAPLVTGVGSHVGSSDAGTSEGPEAAPTSGPIVSAPGAGVAGLRRGGSVVTAG